MNLPRHILDLLEDYRDGTLSPAGQEQLLHWVRESPSQAQSVANWFRQEVEYHEAASLADLRAVMQSMTFETEPAEAMPRVRPARSRTRTLLWLASSAAILLTLSVVSLWPTSDAPVASDGASSLEASENTFPAMLVRLADGVWAPGTKSLRVGESIAQGEMLELQSGLAQLVFESGAEVVLKGPCRLRVDNPMHCSLMLGSVSATVPRRAVGFTIRGRSTEVIDLGTRFGFSVNAEGGSEVHVFQGEVISRQLNALGEAFGDGIHLRKNEALFYPGQSHEVQRLAANEAKFALEVGPLWLGDRIEPLAVERKLALWLRAEHGVQTDPRNGVVAWQDLAVAEDVDDAFQPVPAARPELVPSAMGGRPAIRFNGRSTYLTTTPMATTDDQTIVVVFQYAAPPRHEKSPVGGQIINYNGPPSRRLPDVSRPGVLQLGEKVDSWTGPKWSIAAKAYVGRGSGGSAVSAGVVLSESLGHSTPHVVTYRYDNTRNFSALFVDGLKVAEASAPTPVAATSRKVIGKHGIFDQWYFQGDLAEVLIFNDALSQEEVEQLSHQLMRRYEIDERSSEFAKLSNRLR